jgi:pimeloyl-ACP methyl ester carboxylesterase
MSNTGTIDRDGFKLKYRIEGTGRPAFVIGSSLYDSRLLSQNLRKHLRLIVMDIRVFAHSPKHLNNLDSWTVDTILDDIEFLRAELELESMIVIGHSGNSFLALEYAKKYPQHVTAVAMIAISPDLGPKNQQAAREYWQQTASAERKAALQQNLEQWPDVALQKLPPEKRFIVDYFRKTPLIWYDFHFDPSFLWENVYFNQEVFTHIWGKLFRNIDLSKNLDTFNKPVFLAVGRFDFLVAPLSSWDSLRPKFKDLTVCLFERSGHTPQYEEAPIFDAKLLAWLKQKAP